MDQLVLQALEKVDLKDIFESLKRDHLLDSAQETETHYTSLVHHVLRKYFTLRIKKKLKDDYLAGKVGGNHDHGMRIFQNT